MKKCETIREQKLQIDDMFKQLMDVDKEYNSWLPLEGQEEDEKWFDDIGADMLVFKHKIHNWIREAEHDRDGQLKEKASVKYKRSSKSSSKSSSSRSSRTEKALMEKLRMAELKAEFLEKRQSAEFKAQKLKTEEQYVKSQARMRILEDMQNPEVINAETNPHIYHNEGSKLQLPGEYDNKCTLGMGASHFTENLRKMQAKEYEGIPCDQSSGAISMKKEYGKEPDLVGASDVLLQTSLIAVSS